LRKANIGNFALTGAYLSHEGDLASAVYEYSSMLRAKARVHAATDANVNLGAEYEDGERIVSQDLISHYPHKSPIKSLFYADYETGEIVYPEANEIVRTEIEQADILGFCVGSFRTSILCALHLHGIADSVRRSKAEKLFMTNTAGDFETEGETASKMARVLIDTLRDHDSNPSPDDSSYLNSILVGDYLGSSTLRDGRRFIPDDLRESGLDKQFRVLRAALHQSGDLQGYYDTDRLVDMVLGLR
jgi:uncharacterized cofD-like protein